MGGGREGEKAIGKRKASAFGKIINNSNLTFSIKVESGLESFLGNVKCCKIKLGSTCIHNKIS